MSAARALDVPPVTLTVEKLEEIVQKVCPETGRRLPPCRKSLEPLAEKLNSIAEIFNDLGAVERGLEWQRRANGAIKAMHTLITYFEQRRLAAEQTGNRRIIETEERLSIAWLAFWRVIEKHSSDVEIEIEANSWYPVVGGNWHRIAEEVAAAFKAAMLTTNPKAVLGNSQSGPVARFVAAVIPYITGEDDPGPKAVGEHLTRCARKRKGPV